jgi:hypothetical protein
MFGSGLVGKRVPNTENLGDFVSIVARVFIEQFPSGGRTTSSIVAQERAQLDIPDAVLMKMDSHREVQKSFNLRIWEAGRLMESLNAGIADFLANYVLGEWVYITVYLPQMG